MPTQLYDGPVLDDLLAQVELEHGSSAKIVAARKMRRGGVGGFFSHEWFEVTVEPQIVQQPQVATSVAPPISQPVSILDVAEAINEKESTIDIEVVGGNHKSTLREMNSDSQARTNTAVLDGMRAAQEFAEQLKNLREQNDKADEISVERTVEVEDLIIEDIAVEETEDDEPEVEAPDEVEEIEVSEPVVEAAEPEVEVDELQVAATVEPVVQKEVEVPTFVRVAAEAAQPTPQIVEPAMTQEELASNRETLVRKGVPRVLLSGLNDQASISTQLEEIFADLPTVEESAIAYSHIVAIVGPLQSAKEMANALARKLDLSSQNIEIASYKYLDDVESLRSITCAEEAYAVKRSWRRRDDATIVVIPVDDIINETIWAEEILTAIEPEFTFLVADGRSKIEDVESTIESLSGIDGLIVENLQLTSSPAAVLSLGIPVAYVDSRSATPSMWAAMLTEDLPQ